MTPLPPVQNRSGWPWSAEPPRPTLAAPPRITVVTPSFNQGQYIEAAIRSVLMQEYPNLEYIILDGSSTDDSAAVIERYAPWLAHWASAPDDGPAQAINRGLARATGDILAPIMARLGYQEG